MVEKNLPPCDKIDKNEESNDSESDCTESSIHERNLYAASFPLLALFALLNQVSYFLLIIFRYLWQHILKLRHFVKPLRHSVQQKVAKIENLNQVGNLELPKATMNDNLLVKQKTHHKKAFEYISMALKIDEENEGEKN